MYHMSQVEEFRKAVIPAKPHQLRHGSLYTAEQAQKAKQNQKSKPAVPVKS